MPESWHSQPPAEKKSRSAHWALLAICAIALSVRTAIFIGWHQPVDIESRNFVSRNTRPDSATYILPALALLRTGTFSKTPAPGSPPEIMRTPGYSIFIALTAAASTDNLVLLTGLAQILCSLLTIYLSGLVVERLFDLRAAIVAAAILALDPVSLLYTQLILSDSLFATFLTAHVFFIVILLSEERRELLLAFLAGIALAAASHIRPVSYYLIAPVCIGVLVVKTLQRSGILRAAAIASLIFAAWAPLVVGWQLRNAHVAGTTEFSAIKNHNLLFYRGAGIVARVERIRFDEAQILLEQRAPASARASNGAWNAYCRAEGARLIREHPYLAFKDSVLGLIRLFIGPGNKSIAQYFGRGLPFLQVFSTIYLTLLYALIFFTMVSLIKNCRRSKSLHVFLFGVIVYFALVCAGPEANSRFRVPIMPILAIYAAQGFVLLRDKILKPADIKHCAN